MCLKTRFRKRAEIVSVSLFNVPILIVTWMRIYTSSTAKRTSLSVKDDYCREVVLLSKQTTSGRHDNIGYVTSLDRNDINERQMFCHERSLIQLFSDIVLQSKSYPNVYK